VALAAPPRQDNTLPPLPARPIAEPVALAANEAYWRSVAAQYAVTAEVTNLEAGYWGMMSRPVLARYQQFTERVNAGSSFYARGPYLQDLEAVRARVAASLGVDSSEIALTRGATEALQCLIGGYNRLKPGDAVLYADVDYPAMQYAMKWLADRRGVRVGHLALPEPATRAAVIAAYAAAMESTPALRLLLLTHVNNKTGLVLPVAEIAALARQRGVDVIVDAAHAWGQVEFSIGTLGPDFVGVNLHKWIGAPVGVGAMYIRKGRLADIDRMMANEDEPGDSILSRVHSGTANFAALLSVPAALDFHDEIGERYKLARLRYLRDRWVQAVRAVPGIDVLTPDEPGMAGAITSFRLQGRKTQQDNQRIVDDLVKRYGLFTVRRTGLEQGDCVRVTPALYNSVADVDRLVAALKAMAAAAA
jgi:selenocysteine lyase/cysteine desulfurase